jgi:hypothetical protein
LSGVLDEVFGARVVEVSPDLEEKSTMHRIVRDGIRPRSALCRIEAKFLAIPSRCADSCIDVIVSDTIRNNGLGIESTYLRMSYGEWDPGRVEGALAMPVVEGLVRDPRTSGDLGDGPTFQGSAGEVLEDFVNFSVLGDEILTSHHALEGRGIGEMKLQTVR